MTLVKVISIICMLTGVGMALRGSRQYFKGSRQKSKSLALFCIGMMVLFGAGIAAVGGLFSLLILMGAGLIALSGIPHGRAPIWLQPARTLLCCVIVVTALVSIGAQTTGCERSKNIRRDRERGVAIRDAILAFKGRTLAEKFAGRTALILDDPRIYTPGEDKGMGAFYAAVGEALIFVEPDTSGLEVPDGFKPSPRFDPTYQPKEFDAMLESRDDYDLVISLIGLPPMYNSMKFWRRSAKDRPPFVIFDDKGANIEQMLRSELVTGVFVFKRPKTNDEAEALKTLTPEQFVKETWTYVDADSLKRGTTTD